MGLERGEASGFDEIAPYNILVAEWVHMHLICMPPMPITKISSLFFDTVRMTNWLTLLEEQLENRPCRLPTGVLQTAGCRFLQPIPRGIELYTNPSLTVPSDKFVLRNSKFRRSGDMASNGTPLDASLDKRCWPLPGSCNGLTYVVR